MKRLMYISNLGKQIQHLENAVRMHPQLIRGELDTCNFKKPPTWDAAFEERLRAADTVIVTNMGVGLDSDFLQRLGTWLYRNHDRYWIDVAEAVKGDQDKLCRHLSDDERLRLETYRRTSGTMNYVYLINAALRAYPEEAMPEPEVISWQGIMGQDGALYTSYDAFMKAEGQAERPSIGVYFYRDEWIMGEVYYQKALFDAIRRYGYNPIVFFGQYGPNPRVGIPNMKGSMDILFGKDNIPFDVLINTCKFSFQSLGAQTLENLIGQDIPIIQGYTIYMDSQTWEDSLQGLSPLDINLSVSQPELDGSLHGGVVACQTPDDTGHYIYLPVEERVDAVVRRAMKWSRLRHIPVSERKVAIILHNYPPTNSNIGSAAGLDTPASVQRLLAVMKAEGYTMDTVPSDRGGLMEQILSHATNDRSMLTEERIADAEGHLSLVEYEQFFGTLPDRVKEQLAQSWGQAPGEVLYYDGAFLIPGFSNGNVWISVQPPRGFGENPAAIYHDPCLPPHYQYEAFYYWLRHKFNADAVIHVGTHGSLEWLPGKGAGLSPSCYPEIGIDDLPNIYPYWTTIVGEGIQAKRRSSACLIGYLTPPMSESGTYDEFEELDALLDEYAHFEREHPESLIHIAEAIREKTEACHLIEQDQLDSLSTDALVSEVHNRLSDLKHMQIRNGLHILGQAPEGDDLQEFIVALLRADQGDVPSPFDILAEGIGQNRKDLEADGGHRTADGIRYSRILDQLWQVLRGFIGELRTHDYAGTDWRESKALLSLWPDGIPAAVLDRLSLVVEAVQHHFVPDLRRTPDELTATVHALNGGFVEPGPGGAPSSGRADVLPTGRNFFGVDERALPTKMAYELGMELANQVIDDYITQEKRYPESVGIILWAGSNTRSHGQCLGEFLYLLGVRPVWQQGGRITGLEVIPLHELQRPRIDVTGRISGLIRDMMPNALAWLDKAVDMVAELDESPEDNYIKKHVDEDISWLVDEGEDRETAFQKVRLRVFGDPPQAYGTGVGSLIEQKNWTGVDDIAQVYMSWSSWHQAQNIPQDERLFKRRLQSMEVTIKNEDNRETHILSADDYYSYHGGLIAAVRSVSGKAPVSYVGDSSQRSRPVSRSLTEELRRVVQGETQNPKFIRSMMRHGYKGASDMSNVVSNTFGWDATADVVADWIYTGYAEKYALDKEVREWMGQVNPWALSRIAETLLEAAQRGYWHAPDSILEDLRELYISAEGMIEGR